MNEVELAARNNAEWCDLVCRASGIEGAFEGRLWASARRTPPLYPDAVTLAPGVRAGEILARVDAGPGCSVKDSFADVELPGFDVLFAAEWFRLEAAGEAPAWERVDVAWEPFPPSLLEAPSVAFLSDGASRAVACCGGGVIGIGNVVGGPDAFRGAAAAAQRVFGELPVVGYDAVVPAGCTPIGRLRVLVRS